MNRLDLTVILTLLIILILLGAILVIGNPVILQATCTNAQGCTQLGPFATISLEFSRPVMTELAQNLWTVTPPVTGHWLWQDDRHARWQADVLLPIGDKITFRLADGQAGKSGEKVKSSLQWDAEIRQPEVVFEMNQGAGIELFTIPINSDESQTDNAPRQLTHSGGYLFDYAVSKDGEKIAYSAINDKNGLDIWILRRDGSGERRLLACATDRCTTPSWSPITNEIAYTRESAGLDPNGPKGAPRVWIANVDSGQTSSLFDDPQTIGYGPNWSPDGRWLSIWAGSQGGILVVNRKSGDTVLLNTLSGDTGCWAFDSLSIYYSDSITTSEEQHSIIRKADLAQGTVSMVLGYLTGEVKIGFSKPVCHPLKDMIAVSIQKNGKFLNTELDVLSPAGKDGLMVVDDPSRVFNSSSWNPDGSFLIFQANKLGGKGNDTEIWIWDYSRSNARKLIDGGSFPKFLP